MEDVSEQKFVETTPSQLVSKEYKEFREQYLPRHLTLYEKLCNLSEKILKIKPDKKREPELLESISISHLNITPSGSESFSILGPLAFSLITSLISFAIFGSFFFVLFFIIFGVAIMIPLRSYPNFVANQWRLKTSNQMVQSIFYVVTFMRHTSNLEHAVGFAAEHIGPPLSLDFKKIIWDVETGKYESIRDSIEAYLETWKKWNREFIESFHLIISSLYETSEDRRLMLLDKGLDVMLTETYEKMLHYAHNLKSPITMLHMLGVILPILGLVILPLVVTFMPEIRWYHIAALYNITLPVAVYYLGKKILSERPTGYGGSDITAGNEEMQKLENIVINIGKKQYYFNPIYISIFIGTLFLFIGILPLLSHLILGERTLDVFGFTYPEYRNIENVGLLGPFDVVSGVLSIGIALCFGLGIGYYFKFRSKNIIKIRNETKKLEEEFASALFQLGNRLGEGIPSEMAFIRVSDTLQGTNSGEFFSIVANNITRLGMSVKQAIYDPKVGALVFYPSSVIESSMKVLIESSKKGPKIAAQALLNVSRYIKEIHQVNERLTDLMADVISSIKSQINFLAPVIAGIVIGITSMVSTILGNLSTVLGGLGKEQAEGTQIIGSSSGGLSGFNLGQGAVPTFYFQLIVGVYVVQIIYILTILSNSIENGSDDLNEKYLLGKYLTKSTIMYAVCASIVMIIFNMIAKTIMLRTLTGQ